MSESVPAIIAAIVVAAVGGYLGYRVCKEKKRLAQVVMMIGAEDAKLLASIDELIARGELAPVTT